MAITLSDLLKQVSPDVENEVKRCRDDSRAVIQETLRTECRLAMRTQEETRNREQGAQVPVHLEVGYPVACEKIKFGDDIQQFLLLGQYRNQLEQTSKCTSDLIQIARIITQDDRQMSLFDSENKKIDEWKHSCFRLISKEQLIKVFDMDDAVVRSLERTNIWAKRLLIKLNANDPLRILLSLDEDILGIYHIRCDYNFPDQRCVNPAVITLYWGMIGLMSQWLGCSIEALTIVVLTHELAHAYTQLGADIDGRRWAAPDFSSSDRALIEGLAQYYTDRVLKRLKARYPDARKAFDKMLKNQSSVYNTHLSWVDEQQEQFSPEVVRRAMLEIRRQGEKTIMDFERRLKDARAGLEK